MTARYAKDQPKGLSNYVEKVAIIGAGGRCGKFIVEALLKGGKHKVTAITREGSNSTIPEGLDIRKINYDDPSTLVAALRGQDVLIITLAITAADNQQSRLIEAAGTAGVSWIIPNEFGTDTNNDQLNQDVLVGIPKKKARQNIEQLGKSSWIGVACGFWYEYTLSLGPWTFGLDLKNRTATFFDDGTQRVSVSSLPQTGRAVANLLSLKVLPEDEDDNSVCLSQFRNKFIHVSSFIVNQQDMFESALRVTKTNRDDWHISSVPVKQRFTDAVEEFQKGGELTAFGKRLCSRFFFPDGIGEHPSDNDSLGLTEESLDTYTKLAF